MRSTTTLHVELNLFPKSLHHGEVRRRFNTERTQNIDKPMRVHSLT